MLTNDYAKQYKYLTGIYKWTIENHIYIGSSVNLEQRYKSHYKALLLGNHYNKYFQRAFDKHGLQHTTFEVVELLSPETEKKQLLEREKYWIEYYNADLNLKKDPTTEQSCITTSRKVYQFDRFGNFIREWESESEAGRVLNFNSSGITVCCNNRFRQRYAAGYLWSYYPEYPYINELQILYVFDSNGNFINKFSETKEIYEALYSDKPRKTVLSQLKKKIDSNSDYFGYYISTKRDFKITAETKLFYTGENPVDAILKTNPTVYIYNTNTKEYTTKKLNDFENSHYIKYIIKYPRHNSKIRYLLSLDDINNIKKHKNYNTVTLRCTNIQTGEVKIFEEIELAVQFYFGKITSHLRGYIGKLSKLNKVYKGIKFERI